MKKAFTLIELIVVIAIIAILAAIIAPNAFKAIEKAKIAKAVVDFKTIKRSVSAMYADTGMWPLQCGNKEVKEIDVTELAVNPGWPAWDGPYLDSVSRRNPWGGEYVIQIWDDQGEGFQADLLLYLADECVGTKANNCEVPQPSATRIDGILDDGNLSTGSFKKRINWDTGPAYHDYLWALLWDAAANWNDFITCP